MKLPEKITISDQFCAETGIKKIVGFLHNMETNECRYYSNISSLYRKPPGWNEIEVVRCVDGPIYPDLTDPENFSILINIHWSMFGELNQCYQKVGEETFEEGYLRTRLKAIQVCKSFGGGAGLEAYLKAVKECEFKYYINAPFEFPQDTSSLN